MTGADARVDAAIAAGMLAVALSDGHADPRALALVDAARAALPLDLDVSRVRIADAATLRRLTRAMVEVALVDGAIAAAEHDTIREIVRAHGGDEALIRDVEAELRAG